MEILKIIVIYLVIVFDGFAIGRVSHIIGG